MATFDSYFEEKPPQGEKPTALAGPTFDSYFAGETPPKTGINELENKRPGAVREAIQMGLPALATGGAGILSRPMGIVGKYGLDAIAGAGSEGVLQALGISEDSPSMVALSALAGPTGRLLGSAALGIPKVTPGYRDAARSGLVPHVRDLPGEIIPHGDPKAAYAAIQGNMNTIMPQWPDLAATVAKHITQGNNVNLPALKKMLASGPTADLLTNIEQALQGVPAQVIKEPVKAKGVVFGKPTGMKAQSTVIPAQPPGMTFENAKANIEGLSKLIRDGEKGSAEVGTLKDLKRAMLTDLENMPTPPGTPLAQWNAARAAYRDQKTSMLLDDVIEKNIANREGIEQVNPDGILKALRTNAELKERLTPGQMKELTATLSDWANASGGTRSKLMAMLVGMTIGGGPAGALAGWGGAEILSRALMSEGARKVIGNIIANPSVHNISRGSAVIAAAIRGAFDEPGSTPMPFEEVTPGKALGTIPQEKRTEPKAIEPSVAPPVPILTPADIKAKVTKAAKDVKLDPKLFHAVVSTESNYNPMAISQAGAIGLTQLMPKTAAGMGVNPANVDENLKGGGQYLQSLIKKYDGNVAKALAAYNAGPGRVDKGGPLPQETQDYVAKVLLKAGGKDDKKRR